jgi:hypothetical protein
MTMNSRAGARQTFILWATVASGVFGGLLVIPFADLDPFVWVLVEVCAATVSTLVAFWLLTGEHRPPHHDHRERGVTVPATTTPSHVVHPAGAGSEWWTHPGTPPANPREAQPAGSAPPLSAYVAAGVALVAQCPNCGDFRLDVTRGEPAYAFRCGNPQCRHEWLWTPGADWPAVVVRRNLTGGAVGPGRR